jgi:hypothetical protein
MTNYILWFLFVYSKTFHACFSMVWISGNGKQALYH